MLRITDPVSFRRTIAALCLLAGPLLIFAGDLVAPTTPDGTREYLAFVAEHQTEGVVSTFLFFTGLLLLVPGVLGGLTPLRRRGVVLGHVAAIVATVGLVAFAALVTTATWELELAQSPNRDAAVAIYDGLADNAAAITFFVVGFAGTALGLLLFAAAHWRAGLVPVWVPALVLAGFAAIVIGSDDTAGLVGNGLLVAGLGAVGLNALRTPDARWTAPTVDTGTTRDSTSSSREAVTSP